MDTETGYRVFKLYIGENQRGREPVDAISIPCRFDVGKRRDIDGLWK